MGCNTAGPLNEDSDTRNAPTEQKEGEQSAIPTMLQYRTMRGEDVHNFRIASVSEPDDKIRLDIESRRSNLSVLLRSGDSGRYSFEQNAIVCMIDSAMSSKLDE